MVLDDCFASLVHLAVHVVTLIAAAAGGATASAAHRPKPQIHHTRSFGDILVNRSGYLVYGFSIDMPGKDVSQGIRECLSQWPVVLSPHKLVIGRGVRRSLIGHICSRTAPGSHLQPLALYTYVVDAHPGDPSNVDVLQFGGLWPAVSPSGKFVPSS